MAKWPTDKELEEIYRKGSESHNFEYDPKAWEDMTVLLDKKDNRKVIFFILFGLFFLSLAGIFLGTSRPNGAISNQEISLSNIKKNSTDGNDSEAINNGQLNNAISNQNTYDVASKGILNNESEKEHNLIDLKQELVRKGSPLSDTYSNKIISNNEDPLGSASAFLKNSNSNINPTLNELNEQIADNRSYDLTNASNDITNVELSEKLVGLPVLGISQFSTKRFLNLPEVGSFTYHDDEDVRNNSIISLVGIVGAESSWTPTGEFSSIDYSIGLGINTQLGKKLGFTIGASYIRDLYIANKGDYRANQGFWQQTEEPNYTSANCKMIEVNTGLSYYFNGWENNGLGIQIGVLSNFMLSEQYDYHFELEDMNFSSSWTGSNKTWLNAIDISPIYRFSYGNKGNIEISPYFKIPLNGIGHGDILLSSFGLRGRIRIL